jgi:4-amino-4-deoxy-L-arabinose transferase-like glycosyltransferase
VPTLRDTLRVGERQRPSGLAVTLVISLLLVLERVWPRLYGHALTTDPAVYMAGGMQFAHGQLPYVHLWDIKPPAIHETVGLAALVTGRNPELTYIVVLALTVTTVIAMVGTTFRLVEDLTGDAAAASVGALSLLVYPETIQMLTGGPRVKYFAAAFTLAAVYCYRLDRPVATGVTAGLAAAYWQPAVLVVVGVAVGVVVEDRESPRLSRRRVGILGGLLATAAVVVAPWVLTGKLTPLVGQTVLAPVLFSSGAGPATAAPNIAARLGWFGVGAVGFGVVGIAVTLRRVGRRDERGVWLIAFVGASALGLTTVQHGGSDLIWTVAMLAPCVGLAVAQFPRRLPIGPTVIPVTLLLVGLVIVGALVGGVVGGDRYTDASLADTYWDGKSTAADCHWRMSGHERAYIERTGVTDRDTCWGTRVDEGLDAILG